MSNIYHNNINSNQIVLKPIITKKGGNKSKTNNKKNKSRKGIRKNVARGPNSGSVRLPIISKRYTSSATKSRGMSHLRVLGQSTRKRVKINTPENEIYEFSLGSSEKDWKKISPIRGIPNCKHPIYPEDFPCKKKITVFKNKKEYDRYLDMLESRNESTGYKSRSDHYDDIESILMYKGSDLVRK